MDKWKRQFPDSFIRRRNEIVFRAEIDTLTRRQASRITETGSINSILALHRIIQPWRPKSMEELATRIKMEDIVFAERLGMGALYMFGDLLKYFGGNPNEWIDMQVKVSTVCNKKRKRKPKPVRRSHRRG